MTDCVEFFTDDGSTGAAYMATALICALWFTWFLHISGGNNNDGGGGGGGGIIGIGIGIGNSEGGADGVADSKGDIGTKEDAGPMLQKPMRVAANGCKRLETKFEVRDDALRSGIVAYMHHFGTPCTMPEVMAADETEEMLLEPAAGCGEMQLVMNIAIEDDEEEWRPMHVHVAASDQQKLLVRLTLPRVAAPSVSTSSCEFVCKVAMRNAFLQKVKRNCSA